MNKLNRLRFLLLIFPFILQAHDGNAAARIEGGCYNCTLPNGATSAAKAADMAAIVKITKDYAEVHMHKNDAAIGAVAAEMAKDFYYHDRTRGVMGSKNEIVASLKSNDFVATSISFKPYIVRIFGSTAIAQSVNRVNGAYKGKTISSPFVSVDIFTKQNGRWIWVGSENDKIGDTVSDTLLCNGAICEPNQAAFTVNYATAKAFTHEAIAADGPADAADRAAIISIEKKFAGVQITGDKAAFAAVSASIANDFYCYDHTAGTIAPREEFLAGIKPRPGYNGGVRPYFNFKPSIIRIFGSTGIMKYIISEIRTIDGKPHRVSRVIADVFDKENGRWVWVGTESENVGARVSAKVLGNGTICTPNEPGFIVKH